MPKRIAKTYLPPKIASMLDYLCGKYGLSEGEILRIALLEYAEKKGVISMTYE